MEGLLGNLSGALSDAANGNDDDEDGPAAAATFPFLNKLMGNLAPTRGERHPRRSRSPMSPPRRRTAAEPLERTKPTGKTVENGSFWKTTASPSLERPPKANWTG